MWLCINIITKWHQNINIYTKKEATFYLISTQKNLSIVLCVKLKITFY